jgi:hypothetical protein
MTKINKNYEKGCCITPTNYHFIPQNLKDEISILMKKVENLDIQYFEKTLQNYDSFANNRVIH